MQRLGEINPALEPGRDLVVVRADKIDAEEAAGLDAGRGPTHVIISPGPCTPNEAGNSPAIIDHFAGRVPVLGVCLGHQCIADMHGMTVDRHAVLMHGKTSEINHDGRGIFEGISNPMTATRYHSLVVQADTIPPLPAIDEDGWEVSAWFDEVQPDGSMDRVIMGLRRVWADPSKKPLEGVQFHPESFLTVEGPKLLANFLSMS